MGKISTFFRKLFCNHYYEIESNYLMMMNRGSKLKETMITKKKCSKCGKIITVIDSSED